MKRKKFQKSKLTNTGAIVKAGSEMTKYNATKSGLFSSTGLLVAGERRSDWQQHLASVKASLGVSLNPGPDEYLEIVYAEKYALDLWHQLRAAKYTQRSCGEQLDKLKRTIGRIPVPTLESIHAFDAGTLKMPPLQKVLQGLASMPSEAVGDKIQRAEAHSRRQSKHHLGMFYFHRRMRLGTPDNSNFKTAGSKTTVRLLPELTPAGDVIDAEAEPIKPSNRRKAG